MTRFAYRVYYEWNGPSHADPFRTQKDVAQIKDALERFPQELRHYFTEVNTQVSLGEPLREPASIIVVVVTSQSEPEIDDAVRRCLNGLDLFGAKLERA